MGFFGRSNLESAKKKSFMPVKFPVGANVATSAHLEGLTNAGI